MKLEMTVSHNHIQSIGKAIELVVKMYPDTLGDWSGKHLAIICVEWLEGKNIKSILKEEEEDLDE